MLSSYENLLGNDINWHAIICGSIHSGLIATAKPIELTTSRVKAPQALRSGVGLWGPRHTTSKKTDLW